MNRPRIAVIGAGHLGKIHARLLAQSELAQLVAIVEPDEATRNAVANEHGVEGLASHESLPGRIDGAVIASPTRFHHHIACDLLRHRIPVLVEKPIASTPAEADEMVRLAKDTVVQVGHVERFNPAWQAAQEWTEKPRLIEARRVAPFSCRSTDVGVVLDLMIHDLDLVLSIAQNEVVDVQANGFSVITEHEDVAEVRLEFADGCAARLHASRVNPSAERRVNVWTESGLTEIDLHAKNVRRLAISNQVRSGEIRVGSLASLTPGQVASEHLVPSELAVADQNAIACEHADFIQAIQLGAAPQVNGTAGRKALVLAEQILEQLDHRSQPSIVRPLQWNIPEFTRRRAG